MNANKRNMSAEPLLIRREKAVRVANIFMRLPCVHGVELCGSVARDGQGNDLDLILLVDGTRWSDVCIAEVIAVLKNPTTRTNAERVTGYGFREILAEAKQVAAPATIDIFVFPSNWRDYPNMFQECSPHADPRFIKKFMENLARDAVRIA